MADKEKKPSAGLKQGQASEKESAGTAPESAQRETLSPNSWMPSLDLPAGVEYPFLEMASLDLTGMGLNAAGCSLDSFSWLWDAEDPEVAPEVMAANLSRESLPSRLEALGEQLTDEEREAVADRMSGFEGDALVSEMALVDHALASPNADRALRTMLKLDGLAAWDTDERLTPEIREMLVTGVADARSDSDRGQEGVLGVAGAMRSAEALLSMSDKNYSTTTELLELAGKSDTAAPGTSVITEQQLILKALGARRDTLHGGYLDGLVGASQNADSAMQHVSGFAEAIRGTDRDALTRVTSPLDIHDSNDSFFNKDNLIDGADYDGTNDGLVQRYTDSCGPTVAQTVAAEADPVLALRLHQEGLQDMGTESVTAMEQKVLLEQVGDGSAKSLLLQQELASVEENIESMLKSGSLSTDEFTALQSHLSDEDPHSHDEESLNIALEKYRATHGALPTGDALQRMNANAQVRAEGSPATDILNAYAQPFTGQSFEGEELNKRNPDPDAIASLAEDLKNGQDVPLRVAMSLGGHFVTAVDVREAQGEHSFLIADPSTGKTAWVEEAELTGGHLATVFGWSSPAHLAAIHNRDPK